MRAAVLFLILSFAAFAAAQAKGGSSSGGTSAGTAGGSGMSTIGATSTGTATGANSGTVSPGMTGQPTSGPASEAPTTNLGPSATQPNGTSATQTGTGSTVTGTTVNNGGFITNAPIGTGGSTGSGYVPLLQTPTAAFPSPLNSNLPVSPAGISNNPSALVYSNLPAGGNMDVPPSTTGVEPSLGDVARQYRSRQGQQQASRVYTNADIANLDRQQPGSAIGPNNNPNGQQPNSSLPAGDSQGTTPQTPR